ncbi:MAG TPA: transcription elongation factor GreAB, partial [bacterium]|nr:transcription elongation factor GreAB [bacterium]
MDKKRILETLLDEMRAKLSVLIQSAHAARQEATHEDTKAENKYDTRAIEAGYLAGAQAERVAQLQATISFFERLELKSFSSKTPIEMTALLELKSDGKKTWNFLLPQGGGMKVRQDDRDVFILGVQAPLGKA